ncbi:hypothetical protein [Actinomyces oris]|uniref:hypothetical protein n=1 Tax=Actinomyces oris TaxID=544580 RepID=UPI0028D454EA|nr:hypothetical protein [Actinomyces oris]
MGQKKYPDEQQEWARRKVLEALADPARAKREVRKGGEELGVHSKALQSWGRKAQDDGVLTLGIFSMRQPGIGGWRRRLERSEEPTRS